MGRKITIMGDNIPEELLEKKPTDVSKEILGRYFELHDRRATVRLNFDTFSELVDQSLGDDKVEKLNPVLFNKLAEIFELIPRKYDIEVNVHIKDFGDYSKEEAQKIVKDNITLFIYSLVLERRRKLVTGLSLLGGGVVLLLASYFLNKLNLPQILFDIINISGTLLVWESANLTLIERSAEAKRAKQYIKKLKNITLLQA